MSGIVILLPLITFCAFFLRGLTGFGSAIIIVPATSLILPPPVVVMLAAILDLLAGFYMERQYGLRSNYKFLATLIASMFVGTLLGAYVMSMLPAQLFRQVLGFIIILLAAWLYWQRQVSQNKSLRDRLPERCQTADLIAGFASGLSGGIVAVGGPPVIWHFGRQYQKEVLRSLFITFFLASSIIRLFSYSIYGIGTFSVLYYVIIALPGVILGIYYGNRQFVKVSENNFTFIVCLILVVLGLMLLWK